VAASRRTLALEQVVRQQQADLARAVSRQVAAIVRSTPPDDLRAGLATSIGTAAAVIERAQKRAQLLSAALVRQKVTLEVGRTLPARGIDPDVAGTTIDGRPVEKALGGVGPTVFLALASGRAYSQAVQFGAARAAAVAATETADAGRREVAAWAAASPKALSGWVWVVSTDGGCAACLGLADNELHPWDELMESHPWCTCLRSPEVAGAPDTITRPTGADIYAGMTPTQQAGTFHTAGIEKAALLAGGSIVLADMVRRDESTDWRATLTERPLSDLDSDDGDDDDTEGD
jgi:hypothetical protein